MKILYFRLPVVFGICLRFVFDHILGLPVKPLVYIKRKKKTIEELFGYESEEEADEEDVDWEISAKKKKKNNETYSKLKPG